MDVQIAVIGGIAISREGTPYRSEHILSSPDLAVFVLFVSFMCSVL